MVLNFLRFRQRPPGKESPPNDRVDVFHDPATGKMVARNARNEAVLFDAEGGGASSTDDLTTSDGTTAAATGDLGEYLENGPAVYAAMTSPSAQSVASITLTPGDWSVSAGVLFRFTGATASVLQSAIHTGVSIPFSGFPLDNSAVATGGNGTHSATHHSRRIRVSTNTTYHLVVAGTFTGTIEATGQITARRVR